MRSDIPPALRWLAAPAAVAAATGLCALLDSRMSVAGLAMVYLAATMFAAAWLERGPAVLASVLAVSALNYFFVPPRYSFAIDGAEYWWTLAVLLGASLAVNGLVAMLRAGRHRAELGEARAAELHALSESLAACSGHEAMAQRAAHWLHDTLRRPCAVFLREDAGLRHWGAPADAEFHAASVAWSLDHGRPLGRGCDDWPDLPLWCAPLTPRASAGAVQVLLPGRERPASDTQQHWMALVRQVGLCLERERATAAARAAQDSARSEAARNTLLASLSHDLRTPLAGIVGSASTLRTQGDALSAAQRESLLANLEHEARDMTLLADNILQLARLSQPQAQLRTEWESVEEMLGAAVARMRRRWDGARIQLRVAPGLPPVRAEAGLFAQAIANLVDNALRHAGQGQPVVITAGRSREGLFVAVRDHGPGLGDADPATLFGRYRQGGEGSGAAGIGLAICELVVQAHGGAIIARRCEPGTEFRIDLPVAAAEAEVHG